MQQNFLCPVCWKENTANRTKCVNCGSELGLLGASTACCPNRQCGAPRKLSDRFCGYCGTQLPPICPNCGNNLSSDSRYCPRCSFFSGQGRAGQL